MERDRQTDSRNKQAVSNRERETHIQTDEGQADRPRQADRDRKIVCLLVA